MRIYQHFVNEYTIHVYPMVAEMLPNSVMIKLTMYTYVIAMHTLLLIVTFTYNSNYCLSDHVYHYMLPRVYFYLFLCAIPDLHVHYAPQSPMDLQAIGLCDASISYFSELYAWDTNSQGPGEAPRRLRLNFCIFRELEFIHI